MGAKDFILLIISVAAGIIATAGFALLALSNPNFKVIRICFWIAGICFWSLGIVWSTGEDSLTIKIAISGVCGAVAAMALSIAITWINSQESKNMTDKKETSSINIVGDGNIFSIGQSGGQTAHTIINQAAEPKLKELSIEQKLISDGTYKTTIIFEVISPYPPASLNFETHAPSIIDMDINPMRSGIFQTGNEGKRQGFCFTTIQNPSGKYTAIIHTAKPEQIKLKYNFN